LYYTIGQRKGLGIGGKGSGEPWFVIGKELERNELIVVQGKNNPLRFKSALEAESITWVADEPPAESFTCTAKFRYRQPDQGVDVRRIENDRWLVTFHEKQAGIAPGQVVAFYDERVCLGGGIIDFAIE
jgi:tRNA-specific 2-thiouridylase